MAHPNLQHAERVVDPVRNPTNGSPHFVIRRNPEARMSGTLAAPMTLPGGADKFIPLGRINPDF